MTNDMIVLLSTVLVCLCFVLGPCITFMWLVRTEKKLSPNEKITEDVVLLFVALGCIWPVTVIMWAWNEGFKALARWVNK